jgi:hypothetical protein
MTRWLFDSDGEAVAFLSGTSVYTPKGDFVGELYPDNTIWNGDYVGEIMADDRLFYDTRKLFKSRGLPRIPSLPGFVGEPPYKGPCTVPLGYRDVDL